MTAILLSQTGKITRPGTASESRPDKGPQPTGRFPYEMVEALLETLRFRHFGVVGDEYAVSRDGMRMLGVLDLEYGLTGVRLGARSVDGQIGWIALGSRANRKLV